MRLLLCTLLFGLTILLPAQDVMQDKMPKSAAETVPEILKLNTAPWLDRVPLSDLSPAIVPTTVHNLHEVVALQKKVRHQIWFETPSNARAVPNRKRDFLLLGKAQLPNINLDHDLQVDEVIADRIGFKHHKLSQTMDGIPVFGAQLILHEGPDGFVRMNGALFREPANLPTRTLDRGRALDRVDQDLADVFKAQPDGLVMKVLQEANFEREVIYFDSHDQVHRAWHIKIIPNPYENWEYLIDANSGEILQKWSNICKLHNHTLPKTAALGQLPPVEGSGLDLNGANLRVQCFEENGTFFMYDVTREMFKQGATGPEGAIYTYDAENKPPDRNGRLEYKLVTSSSATGWDPKEVSAHVNGGIAYEYFRQLHGRNSINGTGGSVYSVINVVNPDNGDDYDQAFWNSKFIFYGNGKQAFIKPLQAALDVSAHEMSHGVVENSAGLIYQNQSGAINEAMADFFGVATEARVTGTVDWRLGEQVVNQQLYRGGALRNMIDPSNGGNSLNDLGYQPSHFDNLFTGRQDNGGVHINSGIINRAFALLTNEIGLDGAEAIIYSALTNYLTRSSDFAVLRNAMLAAAADNFGANSSERTAVANAFDAVGVVEESPQSQEPVELGLNPGADLILAHSSLRDEVDWLQLTDELREVMSPIIDEATLQPPSVTDDGTVVVYVTEENAMKFVVITYDGTSVSTEIGDLSSQMIWRNVVISRDGGRIAALTTENDNKILVFDLINDQQKEFELFNPTFSEGVTSGNVQFADAMEFDFTGQFLMYDARNLIASSADGERTYWDIGFLEVFDNETNEFADGEIFKLVTGLPDNVSIGNPVFSKNSPDVIALDYIAAETDQTTGEVSTEYSILGVNIETGDAGGIAANSEFGGSLGYPTYSRIDNAILFNSIEEDATGQEKRVIKAALLDEDKISARPSTTPGVLLEDYYWPVWFSNGERELDPTSVFDGPAEKYALKVFPNPARSQVTMKLDLQTAQEIELEVQDLLGRKVLQKNWRGQTGENLFTLRELSDWTPGIYFAAMNIDQDQIGIKLTKAQ